MLWADHFLFNCFEKTALRKLFYPLQAPLDSATSMMAYVFCYIWYQISCWICLAKHLSFELMAKDAATFVSTLVWETPPAQVKGGFPHEYHQILCKPPVACKKVAGHSMSFGHNTCSSDKHFLNWKWFAHNNFVCFHWSVILLAVPHCYSASRVTNSSYGDVLLTMWAL